jgi:hypothetical protein
VISSRCCDRRAPAARVFHSSYMFFITVPRARSCFLEKLGTGVF